METTEKIAMEQSEEKPNLNVSSSNNIKLQSKTTYARYIFNKMFQMQSESFDDFYSRILLQSRKYESGDYSRDRLLMYKIIVGIRNDMVRKNLMSDADLSLGKALEMCRKSEQPRKKFKGNDMITSHFKTRNKDDAVSLKRKYQSDIVAPSVIYFDGNVPEIQNINDDSLRHIFRYLNLMDGVNMAKTCTRFENFSHTDFFPHAKQIRIEIDTKFIILKAPLIDTFTSESTLRNMEVAYQYFDQFVEDLTFMLLYVPTPNEQAIIWRSSLIMMAGSPYLKALHYNSWSLNADQTDELQDQIEKFEYLTELDISGSAGITNNWRAPYRGIPKIEKLNFTVRDVISTHFLDYFRNLSSLIIDFKQIHCCEAQDLARMFDNNGHCLQILKLYNLSEVRNYSTVGRLIMAKLTKLKSLELAFHMSNSSKYMTELAHLKSLKVCCSHGAINSFLRTLSKNGIIEELEICDGVFIDDENEPQLVFNKLRSLSLQQVCRMPSFWITMTGSHMPVLQSFDIGLRERSELYDLLGFIESKRTIKSLQITHRRPHNDFVLLPFFTQLIQILEEPCTPPRPFLHLNIRQHLDDEEVITTTLLYMKHIITTFSLLFQLQLLDSAKHLLKVVQIKWSTYVITSDVGMIS